MNKLSTLLITLINRNFLKVERDIQTYNTIQLYNTTLLQRDKDRQ